MDDIHAYNAISRFYEVGEYIGYDKLYNDLKNYFKDIYSYDDIVINKLIDGLYYGLLAEELVEIDEYEIIGEIAFTIDVLLYEYNLKKIQLDKRIIIVI